MGILLVITGPTGVGKTELSLRLAERYECSIVSADSRQVFRELPIGTAAPTADDMARVKHYFVATKSVEEDYNAGEYERECLCLLNELAVTHASSTPFAILTGGSMLYIDAVCNGLDDIPSVPASVRAGVRKCFEEKGLVWLQQEVERLDPDYWNAVDRSNPQRLMHCLELCLSTGGTYSSLRTNSMKERPFEIVKIGLTRPRAELYARINTRVDRMMESGLEQEARSVYSKRHLNSLNTVGYKELFRFFDGEWTREQAVDMIRQNSRHYAKRQMTWFNRDNRIHWIELNDDYEEQIRIVDACINDCWMQACSR